MTHHLLGIKSDLSRSYFGGLAVFLIFIVVLLPSFNLPALGGSSEAREAHVARLMSEGQSWILPLRNGLIPSKPPLLHWLSALGIKAFSTDPLATTRFVSLLFGALTLALTYLITFRLGSILISLHRTGIVQIALSAVLILSSITQFVGLSGQARVDMPFAFFSTLALSLLFLGFVPDQSRGPDSVPQSYHFTWFYFGCGLAVLARGPLGLAFPGVLALCGATWLIGIRRALILFARPRLGWIVFLLVSLPWYLLAYHRGGAEFISKQLLFENIERLTGATLINNQPFWFYLPSFLISCLPWSVLILVLAPSIWRSINLGEEVYSRGVVRARQLKNVAIIFVFTGIFFLSLASGKRHSYLLPLLPFFSIFLALHLGEQITELSGFGTERLNRFIKNSGIVISIFALTVGAVIYLLRFPIPYPDPIIGSVQHELRSVSNSLALFLTLVGTLGLWSARPSFRDIHPFVVWAALLASLGVIFFGGHAVKAFLKGFEYQAGQVSNFVKDRPLAVAKFERDESFDALLYYLKREVQFVTPKLDHLPCPGLTLTSMEWYKKLQSGPSKDRILTEELKILTPLDRYLGREERGQVVIRCSY